MTDEPFICEVSEHAPADVATRISAGLESSNAAAAPLDEVRPLACFVRDGNGEPLGGAVGRTWGACAELQQLWVASPARGRGLGSCLVRGFEEAALARGCTTYYLETFSFQAPEFYRSLGYETLSQIEGFAPGIVKYLMIRHAQTSPTAESDVHGDGDGQGR